MLWMRLLHVWGNRSSFPTTSREPPIAPWLFGGLLSDERNKALCSEHSGSSLGLENCRVAVEGVIYYIISNKVTMSLFNLVQPPAKVQLRHRDSISLFCLLYQ